MKTFRSTGIARGLFLLTVGILFSVAPSPVEAAPASGTPEFLLRCAGTTPVQHYLTRTMEHYIQLVQERTNGRVKIELYPSNQLFSDRDIPKSLPAGLVDMSQGNLGSWLGLIPEVGITEVPFMFKDHEHFIRTLGDPGFTSLIDKAYQEKGVKFLFWMDFGYTALVSKTPIKTLEDFRGKRVRGWGLTSSELIQVLGGAPAYLSVGEVYMALQRGTIDSVFTSTCNVLERKFNEVVKHFLIVKYEEVSACAPVLMNLKKFNELPADIQKIMTGAAKDSQAWGFEESMKSTEECIKILKDQGMDFYYLSDKEHQRWEEAARKITSAYLQRSGNNGKLLMEEAKKIH